MNTSATVRRRAGIYGIAALVVLDVVLLATGKVGALAALLTVGLAGYGLLRLAKTSLRRSRLIWRLRNRLIVTYVFIGGMPLLLILALSYFGAWVLVGQVATYLIDAELTRRAATLETPARFLSRAAPGDRAAMLRQMAPLLRDRTPGFEIVIDGEDPLRYPADGTLRPLSSAWKDYTGLMRRGGRFYWVATVRNGSTSAAIFAPLTPDTLVKLIPGIGEFSITESGNSVAVPANSLPPPYNVLDSEFPWGNPIEVAEDDLPNKKNLGLLSVTTRTSALFAVIFPDRLQDVLLVFVVLAALLAVVPLVSIVIGISMTRAVTGAVHNLYEGTRQIGEGDFSHRIAVTGRDQLADLGNSFNQMTAQLENLVVVAKEKERLQSELAIACEVQNQLFPRSAPPARTLELIGACQPARSVSGDYYDYLCLPSGNLAFAIGDVAGKGISAALLMASIQSIMRTQLLAGMQMAVAAGAGGTYEGPIYSTASVVAQLNRQLYANTSPEKYATFFFGLYDENSRVLTYTNGGHLAPLLFSGDEVTELEVTGTVVGLFPAAKYEEQSVVLRSGDLLLAYTDGITEPENAYGEEFGIARLTETVLKNRNGEPKEIVAKVMEAVRLWSSAPELPDDMTVLIARGVSA